MPPENLADALTDVVTRLERAGVDYMLTGSAAGCLYGVMRTPADLDFVVNLKDEQIGQLVEALSTDYYVESAAVADAVEKGCTFSAIALFRSLKADFILLRDEPFDLAAFSRRRLVARETGPVWAIAPAHLVVSTLRWATTRRGGQQMADVRTIMAAGLVAEDDEFRAWVERLRLNEVLDASRTTRYDA